MRSASRNIGECPKPVVATGLGIRWWLSVPSEDFNTRKSQASGLGSRWWSREHTHWTFHAAPQSTPSY